MVSLVAMIVAMCGTSVKATEQYALPDNNYIEMPHDEDVVEVDIFTEEEMLSMCSRSKTNGAVAHTFYLKATSPFIIYSKLFSNNEPSPSII